MIKNLSKSSKVTHKKNGKKVITPCKDFVDSLQEENPDIPNLKKYL